MVHVVRWSSPCRCRLTGAILILNDYFCSHSQPSTSHLVQRPARQAASKQTIGGLRLPQPPPEVAVGLLGGVNGAAVQVVVPQAAARQHHLLQRQRSRGEGCREGEGVKRGQWGWGRVAKLHDMQTL